MARTLVRELTFQTVNIAPTHSPPAGAVRSPDPFIKPADGPAYSVYTSFFRFAWYRLLCCQASVHQQISHRPTSLRPTKNFRAHWHRPSCFTQTGYQQDTDRTNQEGSISSLDSDAESKLLDRPPVDIYVEEWELSDDPDVTITDPDQSLFEEQTYRERDPVLHGLVTHPGYGHFCCHL